MKIIRDWKKLKSIADPKYSYSVVGFTKGLHLFNFTHEHLYKYSCCKSDKLFGIVWDNFYDSNIFCGFPASRSIYDEEKVLSWFFNKKFDYLFIPNVSFIHELLSSEEFQNVRKEVDRIWDEEKYEKYVGVFNNVGHTGWVKLVLSRHYFLFSNNKYVNRTYQAVAPDGAWGFLYKHFWEKYCGGEFPMVPIIRDASGLAYDQLMLKYPVEVMTLFRSMVPYFDNFRTDHNFEVLKSSINEIVNKNGFKVKNFLNIKDEITMNKHILQLVILKNEIEFRLWEYDNDI